MTVLDLTGVGMTSPRTRERLVERLQARGISNEAVLDTFRTLPRHIFVDEALAQRAYEDSALPLGYGQTLSQPYTVARMTEVLLAQNECHKVLEIGTGSGFQSAVLARLVSQVYSVERIRSLQHKARQRLNALALHNVAFKLGDGTVGWPQAGPYDGIMVTAAAPEPPLALLMQLRLGGRLVVPVGTEQQMLCLFVKQESGFQQETIEPVRFVPLIEGVID